MITTKCLRLNCSASTASDCSTVLTDKCLAITMSAPTDPLLALKQGIKFHSTISYSSDSLQIVIGDNSFPKSSPTRYRKAGAPSDFYPLEAVYLAWLLKDAPGAEYMKQVREYGLLVGFVSITERKHVVEWLEGKTSDQDRVAPSCEP